MQCRKRIGQLGISRPAALIDILSVNPEKLLGGHREILHYIPILVLADRASAAVVTGKMEKEERMPVHQKLTITIDNLAVRHVPVSHIPAWVPLYMYPVEYPGYKVHPFLIGE